MAGRVKGTVACIRSLFHLALYVHCASYCLNQYSEGMGLETAHVGRTLRVYNPYPASFNHDITQLAGLSTKNEKIAGV